MTKAYRIEKAFEVFEDMLWFFALTWRLEGRHKDADRLPKPEEFRNRLICRKDVADLIESVHDLLDNQRDQQAFDHLSHIILDVANWTWFSRRVFSLSSSLANMLLDTDLPDFLPRDTKLVAPVFAVALEGSIASSKFEHDFFVCCGDYRNENDEYGVLSFRSYLPCLDDYKRVSVDDKIRAKKLEKRGDKEKLQGIYQKTLNQFRNSEFVGFTVYCPPNKPYNDILLNDNSLVDIDGFKINIDDREILFKLGMGLNLYLQSSRGDDQEVRTKLSLPRQTRGRSILIGAELFDLSVSRACSRYSDPSSGGDNVEVRPHFRRGHWRRPKGFGHDPSALATEWVRPTWVRLDRIGKGEQPVGSLQKV